MRRTILFSIVLTCGIRAGMGIDASDGAGFREATSPPTVWVVNIPNENASVRLSTDHPHEGKQCLTLHYKFLGTGQFQYLGIPNKVKIQAPVHQAAVLAHGDNSKCSYGVQVSDARGETHQYSKNTGQCGLIDFAGWREVVIDLDSPHETWGGDKNGKIDYPHHRDHVHRRPADGSRPNYWPPRATCTSMRLSVDSEKSAVETLGCQVSVVSPEYCSDVKGDTRVTLAAPGFKSVTVEMLEARRRLRCRFHGRHRRSRRERATARSSSPRTSIRMGPITVRISGDDRAREGQLLPPAL